MPVNRYEIRSGYNPVLVKDKNESANIPNKDLLLISELAYNWKILFNPDSSKPAQEVLFSRKKKVNIHPTVSLNNIHVERASHRKHLGVLLDEKLKFKEHIDSAIMLKINKGISVIKKLRHSLPRKSLMTIYKAFLRPYLIMEILSMTNLKMNLFVKN